MLQLHWMQELLCLKWKVFTEDHISWIQLKTVSQAYIIFSKSYMQENLMAFLKKGFHFIFINKNLSFELF